MRLPIACMTALFALTTFTLTTSVPLMGQVASVEAQRLGMEIAWQAQVQLPKFGRGVISAQLWADASQPRKFAIVEMADRTIRVSADELDRLGLPIGIEEAKKQAGEQAARRLGKSSGYQVVEVTIPRIRLVLATSDGLVQTLDAESGRLLWSTVCGDAGTPAHAAALSPAGVSLIQGTKLYLLDWQTGKQLKVLPLRFSSANAIVVCNDLAYVGDLTGRVEAYGLKSPRNPWSGRLIGRSVGQPVALADQSFCAMATTDGFVYTMSGAEQPSLWTRYQTASAINGSLTAGNGAFYVGTDLGILSKIGVEERLGRLEWDFRTGDTITTPALVIGKQVFVVSESGTLYCVDDETGFSQWSRAGLSLKQPLAKAGNLLICRSIFGELYGINASDGTLVAKTKPAKLSLPIANRISDRLYVLEASGQLLCLRAQGSLLPTMLLPQAATQELPIVESEAESTTTATPAANPFNFGDTPSTTPTANPFGGSDPFGGDVPVPGGQTTDPFGGSGANPF